MVGSGKDIPGIRARARRTVHAGGTMHKDTSFPLPPLPTLHTRPSWLNRAGRVDRSACAELRASEARLLIELPTRRRRSPGLEAQGTVTISAHRLWLFHRTRLPFQLLGDHRSPKSNAMKLHPTDTPSTAWRSPLTHEWPYFGFINPNRGASQTKMLGLWEDWAQTIMIQRHRLHARLAEHYLRCPCAKQSHAHDCVGKAKKLFMPLCTAEEARDADAAERWLTMLDAWHAAAHRPMDGDLMRRRAQVWERYGVLFRSPGGRHLCCRGCLGVRYGEVKG
jgi:hypothetical protein